MTKIDFSKYSEIPAPCTPPFSVFFEPKISWLEQKKWDIPDYVVIKVAPVGAFMKREDNPNQPVTPEEVRNQVVQGIEAGACAFHVHARDSEGNHTLDVKPYHEIIDPIKAKYQDRVVLCGCPEGRQTVEESLAPVIEFQGVMETAPNTVSCVMLTGEYSVCVNGPLVHAHVEVMQEVGCKPEIVLHNVGDLSLVKRWLVATGVLKKPYNFRLAMGNPGWGYIEDPSSMAQLLPFMIGELKKLDPDCGIMVDMAGRGGLYIVAFAMILGVAGVRVGMEDAIWMYPHKDEKIKDNKSVVKSVVQMAEALGRRPGTADDYRQMLR
jgi:3-keto-5-aminohexanoate cleavage enzyme